MYIYSKKKLSANAIKSLCWICCAHHNPPYRLEAVLHTCVEPVHACSFRGEANALKNAKMAWQPLASTGTITFKTATRGVLSQNRLFMDLISREDFPI